MGYYSDVSLYIEVKEGLKDEVLRIFERYGYPPESFDIDSNEIRYQESCIKFLGYPCAENMLKELRAFVECGAVDCYGEDREYSVYEFREGKLFRMDYEYGLVGEEEIL